MKIALLGLTVYFLSLAPCAGAAEFKDFAGQQCKRSELVTVAEISKKGFDTGPMKGYLNVTVILANGEKSTAPMPADLIKRIKVGDHACKATFVDEG